jgi:hypothetical protein
MKSYALARDGLKKLNEQYPTIEIHQRDLATVCAGLGRVQRAREQTTDALESLRRAVELHRQLRPTKPREFYNLASELALCARLVAADTPERLEYIDQAVAMLRKAVTAGYKDLKTLEADPDLAAIRSHPGYTEITEQLKDLQAATTNR